MSYNFNGNIFVRTSLPMYPQPAVHFLVLRPAQCDIHYARACSINMTERDSDDRRTDGRTDEDTDRRGRARIEAARVSNTSCLRGLAAPPLARQRFRLCPSFLHGALSGSCSPPPRLYFHSRLRPFLRISSACQHSRSRRNRLFGWAKQQETI